MMFSCQKIWFALFIVILQQNHQTEANPFNELVADAAGDTSQPISSNAVLITDDVIHDEIENDTKKVIRVSPLHLPPLQEDSSILKMDSNLYTIQTVKPYKGKRKYINLQRTKPLSEVAGRSSSSDENIIKGFSLIPRPDKNSKPKHQSKNKNLHLLYNHKDLKDNLLPKSTNIQVTPGVYPVYYVVAKANGRFGKYPLKSFNSPQAFMKYLQKNKLANLTTLQTNTDLNESHAF